MRLFNFILLLIFVSFPPIADAKEKPVSRTAIKTADYAVKKYSAAQVDTLAKMVTYKTVADPNTPLVDNPEFRGFKAYVTKLAGEFGLEVVDHGAVMIVSLGDQEKRFGIVTHGDVQPADPSKWAKDPFSLDQTSEAGKLLGRGTEDDKGPIATALYAMKAIKEKNITLNRRIELMIYLAEESDWAPLEEYLASHSVPDLNVTIDASYPVVTAEKGFSLIEVTIPTLDSKGEESKGNDNKGNGSSEPRIVSFYGGAFRSQIPEDAFATIENADAKLQQDLQKVALQHAPMHYDFKLHETTLTITATGKSAHSSAPETGTNAIAYLADLLAHRTWPKTSAALTVAYISDLVGVGLYGEKFGKLAYQHDFMGPMTLAPTLLKEDEIGNHIVVNIRRPMGKTAEQLTEEAQNVLQKWQAENKITLTNVLLQFGEPMMVADAPHVQKLLNLFGHFTGIKNPQPVAIGGSTNAKLLPNAVSFGPAMPGMAYTGHSEHEFITAEQFTLNLQMYTAMMVEIGNLP